MLSKVFIDASRDDAKGLFQAIYRGNQVPFMTFELRSGVTVDCQLALDWSEYVGKLNFSAFRNAVARHLDRVAIALKQEEALNVFDNDETNDIIFHHPGIIESNGQVNVIVTGIEQRQPNAMCVKLQFLDPVKLEQQMSSNSGKGSDGDTLESGP